MDIKAKVIQHSKHYLTGTELVTYEIEFPRIILAEVNTHKILVRNTQSTRAVPIKSALEQLEKNFYMPTFWGKNKAGMVATEENNEGITYPSPAIPDKSFAIVSREYLWKKAKSLMCEIAECYSAAGYHKQVIGRLLEPFMMIRMVISGTEWDNFFNLRIEPTAQPEFRELAIKMYQELKKSHPLEISYNEWHLPYISRQRVGDELCYFIDGKSVDLDTARKISLSCIAQTSYRKQDKSEEKADDIIGKLFNGDIIHASPAESIGTPIMYTPCVDDSKVTLWQEGVTHMTKDHNLWSAQFRDFIQYRQLIPNNVCTKFTEDKFNQYINS